MCRYGIMDMVPRGCPSSKRPTEGLPPVGLAKTDVQAALPLVNYLKPSHLLSSIGFNAPKALGSPQYLAPVAHTMR